MTAAVIQARMGSSRLPGKSLMPLGSQPVIEWVVERVAAVGEIDDIIVATSTDPADDVLHDAVQRHGLARPVRGHPTDVLARYHDAIGHTDAEHIVRITGDCPLIEPSIVSAGCRDIGDHAYTATGLDGRFPRGFDTEVMTRSSLELAAAEATDPQEREHVTPFIVRRPERFPALPMRCPTWARRPDYRITLDEELDLELLRQIVATLGATPQTLDGRAVIELLDERPDLVAVNAAVGHNIVT